MSEADIRTEIKSVVENIDDIGLCYDYERWVSDWSAFLDVFKTSVSGSDVVRIWTIGVQSIVPQHLTFGRQRKLQRTYTYKVRGYFGVDDSVESEKTAIAIAEDVMEALEERFHTNEYGEDARPAEITVFEPVQFGDVLCHYAEITLEILEKIDN